MKTLALALFVFGLLLPRAAGAAGAFALGLPADVAAQGIAFGTAYNGATRDAAAAAALQRCRSASSVAPATLALCKVVAFFENECLGVSLDPKAATPGYGWAIGVTADVANDTALAFCRATAGPGRASFCVISVTNCDTPAAK